jgi:Protein of unknown function (DUF1360)
MNFADFTLLHFVILFLGSFRITHLFVYDKIFEFVRKPFFDEQLIDHEVYLTPKNFIGQLLSCQWCTGFWVAIVITALYLFFPTITIIVLLAFAIAGAASILQAVIDRD